MLLVYLMHKMIEISLLNPVVKLNCQDQNVPTYIKQMKNLNNITLKLSMFVMS